MDIFSEAVPLWTSVFFFIISIVQILVSNPDSKWIYISLAIGWAGGIAFYTLLSFFDLSGHDWSAVLRSFQNIFFGTWTLITLCEKIGSMKRYKNLKTRMKSWLMKIPLRLLEK